MLEGPGSSVDEYIKFMKWLLTANPISALQIAGVRRMSPSMRYIVMRGLEFTAALEQAMTECGSKDMRDKCVIEKVEEMTGVDFDTVRNGVKNLNAVAKSLMALSPNAQQLTARVTRYILLGERREVRYEIGGWLSRGGMLNVSRFGKGGGKDELVK